MSRRGSGTAAATASCTATPPFMSHVPRPYTRSSPSTTWRVLGRLPATGTVSRCPAITTRSARPRFVRATSASPSRMTSRCGSARKAPSTRSASAFSLPLTDSTSVMARNRSTRSPVSSSTRPNYPVGAVVGSEVRGPANGVRLLQADQLVNGQLDLEGSRGVGEVLLLGRADDRRRHDVVLEHPGQPNRRHRDGTGLGNRLNRVDDVLVAVEEERAAVKVSVRVLAPPARRRVAPGASHAATSQRAPRDAVHALEVQEREHLALLLAHDQAVLVLHRDEAGPAAEVGRVLHRGELPRVHAGGADVAHLPGLDHVVERFHRLFDRRLGVEAVDLVEVDVVGAQPGQRGVDLLHHRAARQALTAGPVGHLPEQLRRQDDVLAAGVLADRVTHDLLARPGGVDIGRVPERDAQLEGLPEDRLSGILVEGPAPLGRVAEAHAAQTDPADLETRCSQADVVHGVLSFAPSPWAHPRVGAKESTPWTTSAWE